MSKTETPKWASTSVQPQSQLLEVLSKPVIKIVFKPFFQQMRKQTAGSSCLRLKQDSEGEMRNRVKISNYH